jgi:flagellar biosynthesis anti-sigma factor FlgM
MNINDAIKTVMPLVQPRTARVAEKVVVDTVNVAKSLPFASIAVDKFSIAPSVSNPGASAVTFDSKKVESIKAAIAAGTFKVNTGKIADGLLASVNDVLNNQK